MRRSEREIFICSFGITRSLRYTVESIRKQILAPAAELGKPRIFAHFYAQTEAISSTGGEEGSFPSDEPALLGAEYLEQEKPGAWTRLYDFDHIKSHGDAWNNNYRSLENLIHQLHSLDRVTSAALDADAELVIFCRPDLHYHDSFWPVLEAARNVRNGVFLPNWQSWGGYNDRFAVACGRAAIQTYGQRMRLIASFLASRQGPLHSEKLLQFALDTSQVPVIHIPQRASRVRASGARVWESFEDGDAAIAHARLKSRLWRILELSGHKSLARGMFRLWSRVRDRDRRRALANRS